MQHSLALYQSSSLPNSSSPTSYDSLARHLDVRLLASIKQEHIGYNNYGDGMFSEPSTSMLADTTESAINMAGSAKLSSVPFICDASLCAETPHSLIEVIKSLSEALQV
jgi:hypothetical protein